MGGQLDFFEEPKARTSDGIERNATFGSDFRHRYVLLRLWDSRAPGVMFLMLNPSTADHRQDDPTVTRAIRFAQRWDFGWLVVCNLFAIRATNPRDMLAVRDPIGPLNDHFIRQNAERVSNIIAAWGKHGRHMQRQDAVLSYLPPEKVMALSRNRDGTPGHPLYLRADSEPFRFP